MAYTNMHQAAASTKNPFDWTTHLSRDFSNTFDGFSALLAYQADNPLGGRWLVCSSGPMIVYPGRRKQASWLWKIKMINV